MKQNTTIFLCMFFCAVFLMVISCGQNAKEAQSTPPNLEGKWILTEFTANGAKKDVTTIHPQKEQIQLEFYVNSSDGKTGFTLNSCNKLNSKYTLESNNKIKITDTAQNAMACNKEAIDGESALSEALKVISKFEMKNDVLTLQDEAGKSVLKFSRIKS